MLNHFRTLLFNETFIGHGEHIPYGYAKKTLPQKIEQLYKKLFPANISRHFKHFLVQSYLNILKSTDFTSKVLAFDPRITYDLNSSDFFKVARTSSITASDPTFELKITQGFNTAAYNDFYYDIYTVEQIGSSAVVSVFSQVKQKYLKDNSLYDSSIPDCWIDLVRDTSNQAQTSYQDVAIGYTGAKFKLFEPSIEAMLGTSGLTWSFVIEGPYVFDVIDIFKSIEQADPFKVLKQYVTGSELDEYKHIWDFNQNPMYKFSAFLLALITVVNNL
jgi:hypothetical protein